MEYIVFVRKEPVSFESDLTIEEAVKILAERTEPNDFRDSLLSAYRYKGVSTMQRNWLLKLAEDVRRESCSVPGPYIEIVELFNKIPLERFQLIGPSFGLYKPKPSSRNAGGLYIKRFDKLYLGKITPKGYLQLQVSSRVEDLKDFLLNVLRSPIEVAMAYGKETGCCSCCSRPLSDPISVYGGIGPVCLSRLGGPNARKELERAFATGHADLSSVLRSAGLLAASSSSVVPRLSEPPEEQHDNETDAKLALAVDRL